MQLFRPRIMAMVLPNCSRNLEGMVMRPLGSRLCS